MSRRNGCSYKKGSIRRDIPSVGTLVGLLLVLTWWAASALLGLASLTSTSWCGLRWQSDWAPYRLGTRASVPGDRSWSLQGRGPNSAARSTLGSLKRFFAIDDWRAVICWLVFGGLWKACSRLHKIVQSPNRRFLLQLHSLSAFLEKLHSWANSLACRCSCRAPVEDGLWIHNSQGKLWRGLQCLYH